MISRIYVNCLDYGLQAIALVNKLTSIKVRQVQQFIVPLHLTYFGQYWPFVRYSHPYGGNALRVR
jgi:hypothetical protein